MYIVDLCDQNLTRALAWCPGPQCCANVGQAPTIQWRRTSVKIQDGGLYSK